MVPPMTVKRSSGNALNGTSGSRHENIRRTARTRGLTEAEAVAIVKREKQPKYRWA